MDTLLTFAKANPVAAAAAAAAVVAPILFALRGKKSSPVLSNTTVRQFPLVKKIKVSGDGAQFESFLFRFALPKPTDVLGLPLGQHISLVADIDGETISRAYTPTTGLDEPGHFDLVIKVYPKGKMSAHVGSLNVGDTIGVKGPKGRFALQSGTSSINMIAGGSGVTPMYQVVSELLARGDKTALNLIYANVVVDDILLKDELDALAAEYPNFSVFYVLNNPPQGWTGGEGFVSQDHIKAAFNADGPKPRVLLCGPPPMNKAMKGHLKAMNYAKETVFQF